MDESPVNGADRSSTSKPSGRKNCDQDATNVSPEEVPPKKLGNRISRLLKRRSGTATTKSEEEKATNETNQKRRQQVYQAQKRHRNRQAEYVANLETEVAQLQHLDSVAHAEMNALAHENMLMQQLLASKSIDHQLECLSLAPTPIPAEDMSQLGSAAVEVRYDPVVGHERTFVDVADRMRFGNGDDACNSGQSTKQGVVDGDNWAALDFILCLEHCCQDHTPHGGINPTAYHCERDGSHGHALSMSSAVYESALPTSDRADLEDAQLYGGLRSPPQSGREKWQLPHSEIDKLVALSQQIPIDDSEMTPAQAYKAIQESVPDAAYVKPVMEALKVLLAPHVACFGFGAVMPAAAFWDHLDTVLKALGLEAENL